MCSSLCHTVFARLGQLRQWLRRRAWQVRGCIRIGGMQKRQGVGSHRASDGLGTGDGLEALLREVGEQHVFEFVTWEMQNGP